MCALCGRILFVLSFICLFLAFCFVYVFFLSLFTLYAATFPISFFFVQSFSLGFFITQMSNKMQRLQSIEEHSKLSISVGLSHSTLLCFIHSADLDRTEIDFASLLTVILKAISQNKLNGKMPISLL